MPPSPYLSTLCARRARAQTRDVYIAPDRTRYPMTGNCWCKCFIVIWLINVTACIIIIVLFTSSSDGDDDDYYYSYDTYDGCSRYGGYCSDNSECCSNNCDYTYSECIKRVN